MEVKTFRGQSVDMDRLRMKNEKQVALGNMGTNARGDKLGRGGKIVQTKEERIKEYYEKNPEPVQQVSIHDDPMAQRDARLAEEAKELSATEKMPVKKASKKITEPFPEATETVAEKTANDEAIDFE